MSIWTQVFLVNFIVSVTYAWVDRNLLEDSIQNWMDKGKVRGTIHAVYILTTVLSFPAWLIYLVVS